MAGMAHTSTGWRGGGNQSSDTGEIVTNVKGLPARQGFGSAMVTGGSQPPQARPTQNTSGNPSVSTVPQVDPPKEPFGRPRVLNVGQESAWRGGADFSNDKLISADRHAIMNIGTELSGRRSGETDPPMDGPPRPALRLVNRTINWQVGNPLSTQDEMPEENRPYSRNEQGMFVGEQGSGWSQINGGVPGLWQPYGSYAGYTAGPVRGIQSPVPQGAPGDGRQSVYSGPPHGLHSQTYPDYSSTLGRYLAVPQMVPGRVDRPDNSKIAGQSYSQTVLPQGQTGTAAQQSGSGINWRKRPASWRGATNT